MKTRTNCCRVSTLSTSMRSPGGKGESRDQHLQGSMTEPVPCTSTPSGHTLQVYGGFDGSQYQASLHKLDINSLNWTQLATPDSSGPMKKGGCGMIAYDYKLLLFGGWTGSEYTNNLHLFDLREGEAVHTVQSYCIFRPIPSLEESEGGGTPL